MHIEWDFDAARLAAALREVYVLNTLTQPETGYNVGSMPVTRDMYNTSKQCCPALVETEVRLALPKKFQFFLVTAKVKLRLSAPRTPRYDRTVWCVPSRAFRRCAVVHCWPAERPQWLAIRAGWRQGCPPVAPIGQNGFSFRHLAMNAQSAHEYSTRPLQLGDP